MTNPLLQKWEEKQDEKLTEVADDVKPFVYDDDNFSYDL